MVDCLWMCLSSDGIKTESSLAVSQSGVHFFLLGCYAYITNKSITIWLQLLMHQKDSTLFSKTKQNKQKIQKLVVIDQRYRIFYVEKVVLYECYGGSLSFSGIFLDKTKI